MNGARLRYILGGAVLGALLGAVYANYLYAKADYDIIEGEIISSNHTVITEEPVRAQSAKVQAKARETREEPSVSE